MIWHRNSAVALFRKNIAIIVLANPPWPASTITLIRDVCSFEVKIISPAGDIKKATAHITVIIKTQITVFFKSITSFRITIKYYEKRSKNINTLFILYCNISFFSIGLPCLAFYFLVRFEGVISNIFIYCL